VLLPPGFGAQFDPLELVGPDGVVFAREGDELEVGGAETAVPPAMQCRVSQAVWFATEVTGVNGDAVRIPTPPPAVSRTAAPIRR